NLSTGKLPARYKLKLDSQHKLYLKLVAASDLPNDVSEFLNSVVFAVNQPNEVELSGIIEKELGAYEFGGETLFNLLDANLVSDSFIMEMVELLKKKKGVFLSSDKCKELLNSIEGQINTLISSGIGLLYYKELENYNIKFMKDQVLEEFLNNSQRKQ